MVEDSPPSVSPNAINILKACLTNTALLNKKTKFGRSRVVAVSKDRYDRFRLIKIILPPEVQPVPVRLQKPG